MESSSSRSVQQQQQQQQQRDGGGLSPPDGALRDRGDSVPQPPREEELTGLAVRRNLRGSELRLSIRAPRPWRGLGGGAEDGTTARASRSRLEEGIASPGEAWDRLVVDWEGLCSSARAQHPTREACRAALAAAFSRLAAALSERPRRVRSLEVCLYQEESDDDVVLDEATGEAIARMLRRDGSVGADGGGALQRLALVNWFGYVPSREFVREVCRGVAAADSIVSLEVTNCALPRGSHRFLSSALRAHFNRSGGGGSSLKRLAVDVGEASLDDLRDLFQALEDARGLETVRVTPTLLPNDAAAAAILERSVAANASIVKVRASFPTVLEPFRLRLEALLRANRCLSVSRSMWEVPTRVPPSAWPTLLSSLLDAAGPSEQANQQHGTLDRAARLHAAYRHAIREALPLLVAPSPPVAGGPH